MFSVCVILTSSELDPGTATQGAFRASAKRLNARGPSSQELPTAYFQSSNDTSILFDVAQSGRPNNAIRMPISCS